MSDNINTQTRARQTGEPNPEQEAPTFMGGRKAALPAPDFDDSEQFRRWLNATRMRLRTLSMEMHMAAAEATAALGEIPAPPGTLVSKSVRRRRARRVTRHMSHGAEAVLDGATAMVRTWGAFRREYAAELAPRRRPGGGRRQFNVVREGGR